MVKFIASFIVLTLLLLPGILATSKRHPRVLVIWLIDVFLGWTIVGWIVALVWALNGPKSSPETPASTNSRGIAISFGVVAALSLLQSCMPSAPQLPSSSTSAGSSEAASSEVSSSVGSSSASPSSSSVGNWTYGESEDKMRGTKTKFAELTSDNSISLSAPYEGGAITLTIRRTGEKLDAYLKTDGQFTCNSFDDETVAVKFDNGPIVHYPCAEAADGSTGILFIENTAGFLSRLKKAKHVVIEAQFFQNGRQQMEFSTEGLNF